MSRIKVDTTNLAAGMFVAQLDRPWLETPFLFQGFEVREESELDLLRHYCRHVYVDIGRSSLTAEELESIINSAGKNLALELHVPKAKVAPRPTLRYRVLGMLSRIDPTGWLTQRFQGRRSYPIKNSLTREVPRAMAAYDIAMGAIDQVFESVRDGRPIAVEEVRQAVGPVIESVIRNPGAMTWFVLLRKRDEYTYNHSIATAVWGTLLGRHLGFDRVTLEKLALGGMLLDIGKARLPKELLQKDSKLNHAEIQMFRKHVQIGLDVVGKSSGMSTEVLEMIANHHERHDGSGYPAGLAGADIPVYGRIGGLVDAYDAMTSNRPYAPARSSYEAIRELNASAGTLFQQELIEQFVQALGMFPVGSIVELSDGRIGIVTEQNPVRRLRPKVMVILDEEQEPLARPVTIDLNRLPGDARKAKAVWIAKGHEYGAFGIDPAEYFRG